MFLRNSFLMPSSATALPFLSFAMLLSSSLRVMSLSSTSVRIWMCSDVVLDTLYAVFDSIAWKSFFLVEIFKKTKKCG